MFERIGDYNGLGEGGIPFEEDAAVAEEAAVAGEAAESEEDSMSDAWNEDGNDADAAVAGSEEAKPPAVPGTCALAGTVALPGVTLEAGAAEALDDSERLLDGYQQANDALQQVVPYMSCGS